MSYAVVVFKCDLTCSVVQTAWIDEPNKCHYPKSSNFFKYIKKTTSQEKIQKWQKFEIEVIHHNIGKLY